MNLASIVCWLEIGVAFECVASIHCHIPLGFIEVQWRNAVNLRKFHRFERGAEVIQIIFNKEGYDRKSRFSRSICVNNHHTLFLMPFIDSFLFKHSRPCSASVASWVRYACQRRSQDHELTTP